MNLEMITEGLKQLLQENNYSSVLSSKLNTASSVTLKQVFYSA